MKIITKFKFWMLAILFVPFFLVSCSDDPDPVEINEAEVLIKYMEDPTSPAANYGNSGLAIKSAEAVHTLMAAGKVYLVDIRAAEHWAAGHIEGSVNLAAGDVRAHIDATDLSAYDEISIICYSGQTASWLTSLLQLAGYKNVYSMKFGMSAWHADFDKWAAKVNNEKATFFVATSTDKGPEGDLPILTTGFEAGADIFESRFDAVLAEGFGTAAVSADAVYANLGDYYIINYWPNEEYIDPGHIDGAMQYTPNVDLALDAALKTLPTNKAIAVYCYTGQNSARIAAYLRMMGYNAKSLTYGANGMIYGEMTKGKWSEAAIMNYDYVAPVPTK
jgi:rhodanese-related sulfurtransferase